MTTTTNTTDTLTTLTSASAARFAGLTWGLELECVDRNRAECAQVLGQLFGTTPRYEGGSYDRWAVAMADGRVWTVVRDGSLSKEQSAEVVTPIMTYTDIDIMQQVVRALRSAGSKADGSCGVHIHLGAQGLGGADGALRLTKLAYHQQSLMFKALQVSPERAARYARPLESCEVGAFVNEINRRQHTTLDELRTAWYGRYDTENRQHYHYDSSRYHWLNLHSLFFRGTIEFRLFNGTMHAGEIRSYVLLCLALGDRARNVERAPRGLRQNQGSDKFAFRNFLNSIGLRGAEFTSVRQHLLKHLTGDASYRTPEQRTAARQQECVAHLGITVEIPRQATSQYGMFQILTEEQGLALVTSVSGRATVIEIRRDQNQVASYLPSAGGNRIAELSEQGIEDVTRGQFQCAQYARRAYRWGVAQRRLGRQQVTA